MKPILLAKTKFVTTAALVAILSSASSHAATILGVEVEDFSSERGGFSREAVNTLDGYLSNTEKVDDGGSGEAHWQTNNDADKFITFDLGEIYQVNSFILWNYMGQDNSDVKDVLVTYGETTALGSTLDTFTFAASSGTAGQERTFSTVSARYLKFDIVTMQSGDASLSSTRAGFTEIEFSAVPEPSTSALLGLFGLSLILRRRR